MTDTTEHSPWPMVGATAPPMAEQATSTFVDGTDVPPSDAGPETIEPDPQGRGNPLRVLLLVGLVAAIGILGGWSWLVIIGALIASIFLHELGHYLVAKWAGMKVTEFFIGFGPRIWSFQWGETEYGFKVIPAGAYVRIIGMSNLEEVDPADEDRTYRSKGYWKRLPVILAGPFANFAIALALLFVLFAGFGIRDQEDWTVGTIVPGSAAEAAGLQSGDQLISVDGEEPGSWSGFFEVIQPTAGRAIDVVFERDGVEQTVQATPGWRLDTSAAAELAPIQEGDLIVSLNGQPVTTYAAFQDSLASSTGTSTVVFEHGNGLYSVDFAEPIVLPDGGYTGFFGIGHDPADPVRQSVPTAAGSTATAFGQIMSANVEGITRLFSPSGLSRYWDTLSEASAPDPILPADVPVATPVDATGPELEQAPPPLDANRPMSIIGIAQIGSAAAEQSPTQLLELLIVVNAFLGMVNLIPLPPLDGGHVAIATYEAIRGKIRGSAYRVDMAKLMPVVYAAFGFLTLFGLSAMYLDIIDPVDFGN